MIAWTDMLAPRLVMSVFVLQSCGNRLALSNATLSTLFHSYSATALSTLQSCEVDAMSVSLVVTMGIGQCTVDLKGLSQEGGGSDQRRSCRKH